MNRKYSKSFIGSALALVLGLGCCWFTAALAWLSGFGLIVAVSKHGRIGLSFFLLFLIIIFIIRMKKLRK